VKLSTLPSRSLVQAAAVALLAGAAMLAGAADPKAAKLYEDALTRFEKKDTAGAIIQLKNALQIDKSLLPVHVLLGRALLANSDPIGAEVAFTEALRLGVNRAEVVVPMAQALIAQGKRQPLLDDARYSPTGLPLGLQAELRLMQATAYADLGKPREALKAVEAARALTPADNASWLAEVPIRVRARQFAEAAAAADRALTMTPTSAEALYVRGTVWHAAGNLKQALALYDKVLGVQPSHVEALLARAGIALDQNRTADAKRDIAELRRTQPKEPRGVYLAALVSEREGDAKAARAAMAELAALIDPVPPEFLRYRLQFLMLGGLAHYSLGEMEKARPYFEAMQREQPSSPTAKLLAQILLSTKNVDRAIGVLDSYLRDRPGDSQALSLLASAHMSLGRHARATQLMQDALKGRDTPSLRTMLGMSLLGGGRLDDALAELKSAYAKDSTQVQAGAALVSLYLRAQRNREAVEVAEALVKRQPALPGLQNLAGTAYLQAGDAARARAAFEQALKLDDRFVDPALNLARMDARDGRFDAAAARLNGLLKVDEKNVPALIELGLLAERQRQTNEATRLLTRAADLTTGPDLEPAFALLEFHLRGDRVDGAQEAARRLNAKAPEDVVVLMANARVALMAQNPEAARSYLVKATRLANFDAPAQTKIALLQLAADDPKAAAYSLSKALTGDPTHLPAMALLNDAEVRMGSYTTAEQRAREITTRHPKLALGPALTGDVAMARGQTAAAIDAYRRAHQLEPSSQSLLRLQRATAARDPAAAVQLAEQWLKTRPQDTLVRRTLADDYLRTGNLPAAKSAYEALLKQTPNNAEALNNYAHVLLTLRDTDGAQKAAAQALSVRPEVPHIIGTAGWVAFKSGQADRALQLLRDARLRDPANPETRYYLATVLAATGRNTEARDELQAALKGGAVFASAKEAQQLLQSLK